MWLPDDLHRSDHRAYPRPQPPALPFVLHRTREKGNIKSPGAPPRRQPPSSSRREPFHHSLQGIHQASALSWRSHGSRVQRGYQCFRADAERLLRLATRSAISPPTRDSPVAIACQRPTTTRPPTPSASLRCRTRRRGRSTGPRSTARARPGSKSTWPSSPYVLTF